MSHRCSKNLADIQCLCHRYRLVSLLIVSILSHKCRNLGCNSHFSILNFFRIDHSKSKKSHTCVYLENNILIDIQNYNRNSHCIALSLASILSVLSIYSHCNKMSKQCNRHLFHIINRDLLSHTSPKNCFEKHLLYRTYLNLMTLLLRHTLQPGG